MSESIQLAMAYLAAAPFVVMLLIKSTLIVVAGLASTLILRNVSAAVRHSILALTTAAALAVPLGMVVLPALKVMVKSPSSVLVQNTASNTSVIESASASGQPVATLTGERPSIVTGATQNRFSLGTSLLLVWLAGTVLFLARMIVGRIALSVISRRGTTLDSREWSALVSRSAHLLDVVKPVRVLSSHSVSTPLTSGLLSPVIILPEDAEVWTTEHREVVLRHELAHIAGGDVFIGMISGVACAVYWFNPLMWIAARRLRSEQERACDDRVIELGTPAPDYASHLLEVARSARDHGMHGFVSVAMARPSQLEGRLLAVINPRNRDSLTRSGKLVIATATFSVLGLVSAVRPAIVESAVTIASQTTVPAIRRVLVTAQPSPDLRAAADSTMRGSVEVRSGGTLTLDLNTGASVSITGTERESSQHGRSPSRPRLEKHRSQV